MKLRGYSYVERSNGAVAIEIDGSHIFFHGNKIVAVKLGHIMYRLDLLKGGIVYQRIKAAIQSVSGVKTILMTTPKELQQHAETVMALAVSRAFDERLLGDGK